MPPPLSSVVKLSWLLLLPEIVLSLVAPLRSSARLLEELVTLLKS